MKICNEVEGTGRANKKAMDVKDGLLTIDLKVLKPGIYLRSNVKVEKCADGAFRISRMSAGEHWDRRAKSGLKNVIPLEHKKLEETGQRDAELLVQEISGSEKMIALDFGCGIGRVAKKLASKFRLVYAVDISKVILHQAKEYMANTPNVRVKQTNGETLPFSDGYFDCVFSVACFQHMPKEIMLGCFSEIWRTLKNKGWFRFCIPLCKNQDYEYHVEKVDPNAFWISRHYLREEIHELLKKYGFKTEKRFPNQQWFFAEKTKL